VRLGGLGGETRTRNRGVARRSTQNVRNQSQKYESRKGTADLMNEEKKKRKGGGNEKEALCNYASKVRGLIKCVGGKKFRESVKKTLSRGEPFLYDGGESCSRSGE